MRTVAVVVTIAALALAACADDDAGTQPTPPLEGFSPTPMPTEETTPPEGRSPTPRSSPTPPERLTPTPTPQPPRMTGEVPQEYLEPVVDDAAGRAGVASDDISIVRAQAVQWPDGSLGCPEPGRMYTQAIVDGYWVELEAGEQVYDYRLDGQGRFRLCTSPGTTPLPPGGERS